MPATEFFGVRLVCPSLKETKIYLCPGQPDGNEDLIETLLDFSTMKWRQADKRIREALQGVPFGAGDPVPEYEYLFYLEFAKEHEKLHRM